MQYRQKISTQKNDNWHSTDRKISFLMQVNQGKWDDKKCKKYKQKPSNSMLQRQLS
jgi:hypothetical protein